MMKIDDGHGFGEEGDSTAMRKIGFQFVVEKRKRLALGIVWIEGVGRRGRGRDGDGWQGRGSEGELSPSSCLGFQRGRGGGRWTDSDSLQPHSNMQICNPSDLGGRSRIGRSRRRKDWTGYERSTSDRKKSTEKYTAAVSRRGARWVALASPLIASCHSLNSMLKFSICFGFSGNSQSRSIPSKPRFRATSKALGFNKLNIISFVWTLACGFDGASNNRL
ncbi:hypothetical protein SLEP1_g11571 [Rubroshorea leprosula]|nr:hypothetical protein SLEP1_g11571 [Rubroshorea leprosula]